MLHASVLHSGPPWQYRAPSHSPPLPLSSSKQQVELTGHKAKQEALQALRAIRAKPASALLAAGGGGLGGWEGGGVLCCAPSQEAGRGKGAEARVSIV